MQSKFIWDPNKNEDSRSYYLRDCVCNLYRHSSRMVTWGGLLFIAILVSIMRTYGKQQEMGDEEYILRHNLRHTKTFFLKIHSRGKHSKHYTSRVIYIPFTLHILKSSFLAQWARTINRIAIFRHKTPKMPKIFAALL